MPLKLTAAGRETCGKNLYGFQEAPAYTGQGPFLEPFFTALNSIQRLQYAAYTGSFQLPRR